MQTSVLWAGRAVLATVFLFLVAAPWMLAPGQLVLLTQALTMLCLAMLWNVVAGYGNIVVIGQHAFVGIGSYATYGFAVLMGWSLAVTVPAVMAISLVFGVVVYGLIFRLRTAYLAVGSWVVAETLTLIASRLGAFGGGSGIALPTEMIRSLGAKPPERLITIYLMALVLAVGIFFGIWAMMRSRLGLALAALRDNEEGAAVVGVNTFIVRATTFILAAPLVGLVGLLVTLQKGRISHIASFSMGDWTIYVLFIVVIGGLGSLEGPLIGTVVFFVLRQLLQNYGFWYPIAMGLLAIVVILAEPRGLWGMVRRKLNSDLLPLTNRPPSKGKLS